MRLTYQGSVGWPEFICQPVPTAAHANDRLVVQTIRHIRVIRVFEEAFCGNDEIPNAQHVCSFIESVEFNVFLRFIQSTVLHGSRVPRTQPRRKNIAFQRYATPNETICKSERLATRYCPLASSLIWLKCCGIPMWSGWMQRPIFLKL